MRRDLFENWNRYYDSSTGRYLQPEPVALDPKFLGFVAREGRSLPTYAYAQNNPVQKTDPNGEFPDLVCAYTIYKGMSDAMNKMNCRDQDKWFHCMTSCMIKDFCDDNPYEGSAFSYALGAAGEYFDIAFKMCYGMPFGANVRDSAEGMAANIKGLLPPGSPPSCLDRCKPIEPPCFNKK